MNIWVLTGADREAMSHRRQQLLNADGFREDCDCAEDTGDGLISAISSVSMFGERRLVACEHFEKLSEINLTRFLSAAAQSDARVVCRADDLPAGVAKKLVALGVCVERFALPRGKDVGGRIVEIAQRHKIVLGFAQRKLLQERCGHDLERVRSICWQLNTVEAYTPSVRQITTLLGSANPEGVPWAVTDALERGDTALALEACRQNSAGLAVLGYLASQITNAGLLLEAGVGNAAEAEKVLGLKRFPAEKALALSRRLGASGVRSCWEILSAAESHAKTGVGEQAAVEIAVIKLAKVWAS